MLKLRITSLLLVIFLLSPFGVVFGQVSALRVDRSQLENGVVRVNYMPEKDVLTKVTVSKGDDKYTYALDSNSTFPLQLGDGEYTITVLENIAGSKYKVVGREKVTLELANKNNVFLQSIQNINWHEDMEAVKKARELTEDARDDKEKVVAIYNYVINNISYDYDKASSLNADYLPSIEETVGNSQGICYDFAALFAAMLRSVDVPAKLIMGYKNDIETYHAWNQVYLKDIDKWVTIDTTYDSIMVHNNLPGSMIKTEKEYSVEKQY